MEAARQDVPGAGLNVVKQTTRNENVIEAASGVKMRLKRLRKPPFQTTTSDDNSGRRRDSSRSLPRIQTQLTISKASINLTKPQLKPSTMAIPTITVLGSLNIDLTSYVPHHPQPGETLTSTSFVISPGGKGANQATACAKLSRPRPDASALRSHAATTANVSMIGAVGADPHGETLLSALSDQGVDVSRVERREGGHTGVAVIVVDEPSGENRIMLSPEANHSLRPADFALPSAFISTASSDQEGDLPHLLVMQLEIPLGVVTEAARTARDAGIPILLNAAPAPPSRSAAGGGGLPAEVLALLAHLVVNETEACALAGCPPTDLDTDAGLEKTGAWFLEQGVENLIITLGARGAFFANKWGIKGFVAAEKTTVFDTTAAGDTFVGAYSLAVVSGGKGELFDMEDAVRTANKAAAKTVQKKGAQDSIPWKDELES